MKINYWIKKLNNGKPCYKQTCLNMVNLRLKRLKSSIKKLNKN